MGQRDISPSIGGKRSSRLAWSVRCNSFLSVLLLLGASLLLEPLSAASSSLSVTSGNGTTTYAIHMMVPLTDASQNQTQVLQWISSAVAAAKNVTNQWRSTTGNSLEIYVLDNQGNAIINTNNAISSSTNASAITLLACGSQAHPDFVDEVARIGSFFHAPVLSSTARATSQEANASGLIFRSLVTPYSFEATVFESILDFYGWEQYSVLADGLSTTVSGITDGLLNLSSSSLNVTGYLVLDNAQPQNTLRSCSRNNLNVLAVVGSNVAPYAQFFSNATTYGYLDERYVLMTGFPASCILDPTLPQGVQVLEVIDGSEAARSEFFSMMQGKTGFSLTANITDWNALMEGAMLTYDAVMAVGRAIEVAEQTSIPATRLGVWQALQTSDYVGFSGPITFDENGFRKTGYARILNNNNGTVVVPFIYNDGILTQVEQPLYPGNELTPPVATMVNIPLGEISNIADLDWLTMTPVLQFAIDLVNQNSTWMPPNHRLFLVPYFDNNNFPLEVSGCNLMHNMGVAGVVGPYASYLVTVSNPVLAAFGIPQSSPAATAVTLSSKTYYPSFWRNVPSDTQQATALLALCSHYGWHKVALVSSIEDYGSGLAQAVANASSLYGVTVVADLDIDSGTPADVLNDPSTDRAANALQQMDARIVIVVCELPMAAAMAMSMQKIGYRPSAVLGPDALFSNGVDYTNFITKGLLTGGVKSNLTVDIFNGWLSTNPATGNGDFFDWIKGEATASSPIAASRLTLYNSLASLVVDTVFIYANAIKLAVQSGNSPFSGLYNTIIQQTNLTLCTGPTTFDAHGDRIDTLFDVDNIQNGSIVLVGRIFGDVAAGWNPLDNDSVVLFLDGTPTVPLDSPARVSIYLGWSTGGGIVMAILAFIGLAFAVGTVILLFRLRGSPILISATWEFLVLMVVGSAIGAGSILTWIGEPVPYLCALRIWLPPMAFIILIAPLLAKTWRLHRIFTLGSTKVSPITLWRLVIFAGSLILVQVVICIFWISFGTIEPIIVFDPSSDARQFIECGQNTANHVCAYITFAWNGFCLVIGSYYAFRVRNLPKEWNESRWIGFTMYNAIVASVVPIILGYSLGGDPVPMEIVICIGTWVISMGSIGLMLIPKMYSSILHPENRSPPKSTSTKSGQRGKDSGETVVSYIVPDNGHDTQDLDRPKQTTKSKKKRRRGKNEASVTPQLDTREPRTETGPSKSSQSEASDTSESSASSGSTVEEKSQ